MGVGGVLLCAVGAVLIGGGPAEAQTHVQVPAKNQVAVSAAIGLAGPNDPSLDTGVDLAVSVEDYLTPRVSVRGELSGAWWDISGHSFTGQATPLVFDGNVVYNFEGGKWHPYLTGGVGLYRYRFTESRLDSHATKFGMDLGAGVEYFVHLHWTVTGEWQYHIVSSPVDSFLSTYDSHFWVVRAGVKHYF